MASDDLKHNLNVR